MKNDVDEGVSTQVYVDGEEIRLNIVDCNTSVLVTFSNEDQFEQFCSIVEKAKKEIFGEGTE